MSTQYKCGDRVALSSGGPVMAVTGVYSRETDGGTVCCAWFDDAHQHQTACFQAGELSPIELAELGSPA